MTGWKGLNMQALWKTIKHNHVFVACIINSIIIIAAISGCEPRTKSLIYADKPVTRAELNIELDTLLATSKLRLEDLDRQEELRNLVFQSTMLVAEGGALSWPGLLLALGNLMGIGAVIDNRRKDALIKTYKNVVENNAGTNTT